MKINFIQIMPVFQGKCTIGKNAYHKSLISDALISSSSDYSDVIKKNDILEETAKTISEQTPQDANLYIDIPYVTKSKGFFTILPYNHSMSVYEKGDSKEDKLIAHYNINSMSKFSSLNYVRLSSQKIIEEVKSYYDNP